MAIGGRPFLESEVDAIGVAFPRIGLMRVFCGGFVAGTAEELCP